MISKKFCKSTNNQHFNNVVLERELKFGHHLFVSNTQVDLDVLESTLSLTDEEKSKLDNIGYERRKREFLGVRSLVQGCFGTDERIVYAGNGKPMLQPSDYRISISHSGDLEAVLLHENIEVGIDLQLYTEKILKINKRFLSEDELNDAGNSTWKTLVYWCAKEALFKYYAKGDVDFRKQLFVEPFEFNEVGDLVGHVLKDDGEQNITMCYEKYQDYMLAYTLNG